MDQSQRLSVGQAVDPYLLRQQPREPTLHERLRELVRTVERLGERRERRERTRDQLSEVQQAMRSQVTGWLLGRKIARVLSLQEDLARAEVSIALDKAAVDAQIEDIEAMVAAQAPSEP
jgi:hypothetical protein